MTNQHMISHKNIPISASISRKNVSRVMDGEIGIFSVGNMSVSQQSTTQTCTRNYYSACMLKVGSYT